MEQTLETKTIDRAPCRSDPFQAPNPEFGPAMLVRSGPGSSLLYAPDFPGRKSPCRNAAQAHESENLDAERNVGFFAFIDNLDIDKVAQVPIFYKCVRGLYTLNAPPVSGRFTPQEAPLVPTGGVSCGVMCGQMWAVRASAPPWSGLRGLPAVRGVKRLNSHCYSNAKIAASISSISLVIPARFSRSTLRRLLR